MIRHFVRIASIALCSLGSAAWAQSSEPPANVVHADSAKHAVHTKNAAKKSDDSENWVIADPRSSGAPSTDLNSNLAEGRKKFFEQSTTMEDGGPANSGGGGVPANTGEATGFTPSAGLPF
jgi:hypothetical protein